MTPYPRLCVRAGPIAKTATLSGPPGRTRTAGTRTPMCPARPDRENRDPVRAARTHKS